MRVFRVGCDDAGSGWLDNWILAYERGIGGLNNSISHQIALRHSCITGNSLNRTAWNHTGRDGSLIFLGDIRDLDWWGWSDADNLRLFLF